MIGTFSVWLFGLELVMAPITVSVLPLESLSVTEGELPVKLRLLKV